MYILALTDSVISPPRISPFAPKLKHVASCRVKIRKAKRMDGWCFGDRGHTL